MSRIFSTTKRPKQEWLKQYPVRIWLFVIFNRKAWRAILRMLGVHCTCNKYRWNSIVDCYFTIVLFLLSNIIFSPEIKLCFFQYLSFCDMYLKGGKNSWDALVGASLTSQGRRMVFQYNSMGLLPFLKFIVLSRLNQQ
jgi:hypothetical protein